MFSKLLNNISLSFKPYYNNAVNGRLKLYTLTDLVNTIRKDINIFSKYDGVIGIARSGLLPASIIALLTGKPLGTVDSIINGYLYLGSKKVHKEFNKLLLVDDSTSSGYTINEQLTLLNNYNIKNIGTYSVFVHNYGYKELDHYSEVIEKRTLYEWNILKHKRGYKVGFDLDGVLAEDYEIGKETDIEKYEVLLENAEVFVKPSYKIDYIVTNRLERFRSITIDWLIENSIDYDKLYMWNEQWDNRKGKYAKNKVKTLKNLDIGLYVESGLYQAKYIFNHTNIPTLCYPKLELFS